MSKLVEAIRDLTASVDETKEKTNDLVSALMLLLDEVTVDDEEVFYDWTDKIGQAWCEASGNHKWTHDHCGFWGHQFCDFCHQRKYPEVPSRCGDCLELMKMTEDQYMETRQCR